MSEKFQAIFGISFVLFFLLVLLTVAMWGCPKYNVYSSRMGGEAQLAHAVSAKQVAIQEAHAKMESASMLAEAEVKRAEGVAKANKIIGDSLKNNDAYLRYLWIDRLEQGQGKEVIYVPTEAGLPILEAGKR